MDVTPLVRKGQQIIQSYSGGVFKISGQNFAGPVIVYPEETIMWNLTTASGFENLAPEDFAQIISRKEGVDVVLLGCGTKMQFLSAPLKAVLKSQGLHIETMDTGAACRTYNVLMAEGRRVAAALMPV